MIRNYLKIAWRNLIKNKASSFINVGGLAVGMAVAMLISLWIWDELSYNKYFPQHAKLAQLMTTQTFNDEVGTGSAVSMAMATELRLKNTSDFKYVTLSSWNFDHIFANQAFTRKLNEYGIEHGAEEYNGPFGESDWGAEGRIYTEVLPFFAKKLAFGGGR